MSLIDQIFEQSKLGTAPDPSANPFVSGVALGQHQQQINMELAQLPLKQTLLQQDAQLNSLRLEQGLKARQDDIEATAAWGGLSGAVNDRLKEGDLGGAITAYTKGNSEFPALWVDPRSQALGKQLDAMQRQENAVKIAGIRTAGSELRYLPPGVKLDRLLQEAQTKLDEAQDDPVLAQHYQQQIDSLNAQKQIEADKLKVQKDKVVNEADRIKASQERTAAIRQNTQALLQRLAGNDRVALNSELRTVDDVPNSKMDYAAKLKEKERILEKYKARAKEQTAPAAAVAPVPPASVPTASDRVIVVDKDGNRFWIPSNELERAHRQGYTPE